jgi:hypothetical protein
MNLSMLLGLVAALSWFVPAESVQKPPACQEWRECRDEALEAAGRGDFERFHDLAWRTVQKGPPRDPDLMYLLARAQSLSGRSHDALVMIGRLADAGVVTDAATNRDFAAIRTLQDWPAVKAQLELVRLRAASARIVVPADLHPSRMPGGGKRALRASRATAPLPPSSGATDVVAPVPVSPPPGSLTPAPASAAAPPPAAVAITPRAPGTPPLTAEEAVRVPSITMTPSGLAYDRVSGRFVIADRLRRKLVIVDDRSHHVVDLVGAESAGFNEITALVIDARRGDLWVVSAGESGEEKVPAAVLHRLQLVSGRPLASWPVPESFGPTRFGDVDVGTEDTVVALDVTGKRIFRVTPRTGHFSRPTRLPFEHPTSLAVVGPGTAYVAHDTGISRVPLPAGAATPLSAAPGVDLKGFERIRWDGHALLGIQRTRDGLLRAVRLRLGRSGTRVLAADIIDPTLPIEDATTASVSDDAFYFVTRASADGGIVVHRTRLR